jgi:hypothetical protein
LTAGQPQEFPGYTVQAFRDGALAGLISVHAASGEVWPHTWHGQVISTRTE